MADKNKSREGEVAQVSVKVDVDCSDAITGLKAVQREARKAVKEVRELESYYETEGKHLYTTWTQEGEEVADITTQDLTAVPTAVLVRELAQRDGVERHWINDEVLYEVRSYDVCDRGIISDGHGPARILVVTE